MGTGNILGYKLPRALRELVYTAALPLYQRARDHTATEDRHMCLEVKKVMLCRFKYNPPKIVTDIPQGLVRWS